MGSRFLAAIQPLREAAIDTNACIYYLQDDPQRGGLVASLLARAATGSLAIEVSGIARMELLVRPYRDGDAGLLRRIEEFMRWHPGIEAPAISAEILKAAAELRGITPLKAPDALIVASAAVNGRQAVIGNDAKMKVLDRLANVQLSAIPRGRRLPSYVHLDDFGDDD